MKKTTNDHTNSHQVRVLPEASRNYERPVFGERSSASAAFLTRGLGATFPEQRLTAVLLEARKLNYNQLKRLRRRISLLMDEKLGATSHERVYYNPGELISPDRVEQIFSRMGNRKARVAAKCCYYLQLRRGEACRLSWQSLDLEKGCFFSVRSKNAVRNSKPVPGPLLEELRALSREDGFYVFRGSGGGAISDSWLANEFREACEKCGFSQVYATKKDGSKAHCYTLKGLRASGISRVCDAVGGKVFLAADIVGHKNPRTTMVYYRGAEEEKRTAVEKAFS